MPPVNRPRPGNSPARGRPAANMPPFQGIGKSALVELRPRISVRAATSVDDSFATGDNFVKVWQYRDLFNPVGPQITDGVLKGEGVVRHRVPLLSDSMAVECVIGTENFGRCIIIICANKTFTSWYGLELHSKTTTDVVRLMRGYGPTKAKRIGDDVLGEFSAGDEFGIWYDADNSILYGYKNGTPVISASVRPNEIMHGYGFRHHGIFVGKDLFLGFINEGPWFTSYHAEDVLL